MAKKKTTTTTSSVPASRWLAILGLLFALFLFGTVLYISQRAMQQPQDVRRSAMVADGAVKLTAVQSPAQPRVGIPSVLEYRIDTQGTSINGVELVFDIITDTISAQDLQLVNKSNNLIFAYQEVDEVDHGLKVRLIAILTDPNIGFISAGSTPLFELQFTPQRAGSLEVDFDVERSIAPEYKSNPIIDHLSTIPKMTYQVLEQTVDPDTDEPQPPSADDLFFSETRLERDLRFFTNDTDRRPLNERQLRPGTTYRFSTTARVANRKSDPGAESTTDLVIRLSANDQQTSQTIPYRNLLRTPDVIAVALEGTFTARTDNSFSITLDPDDRIAESSTSNNRIDYNFSLGSTTTSTSVSTQCNERCSSNANCPVNYRCYDTGSDGKRCRLATNVSSSSCTTSTSSSGATTTTTSQTTIQGCNQACASNSQCATNLRCYQGSCRLATNPSSLTCSAATKGIVSEQYADPKPTPTPTPLPTPEPTPAPTPLTIPSPTPEAITEYGSAWDAFLESVFGSWNEQISANPLLLPIGIIGIGLVLLIIVVALALRPARHTSSKTLSKTPAGNATPTSNPANLTPPRPNPPPPPLPGHGVTKPNTMLERLQAKGIKKPGQS